MLSPRAVAFWTAVSGVCAVVGTVVAVVQLGADDGRVSSSSSGEGSAGGATTPAATTPPSTPTPSPKATTGVEWRGRVVLPYGADANLDSTPPFVGRDREYVEGADVKYARWDAGPEIYLQFGATSGAVWQNAAQPTAGQCDEVVGIQVRDLVEPRAGLYVCVRTVEDTREGRKYDYRVVLLHVTAADDKQVTMDVLRWAAA